MRQTKDHPGGTLDAALTGLNPKHWLRMKFVRGSVAIAVLEVE